MAPTIGAGHPEKKRYALTFKQPPAPKNVCKPTFTKPPGISSPDASPAPARSAKRYQFNIGSGKRGRLNKCRFINNCGCTFARGRKLPRPDSNSECVWSKRRFRPLSGLDSDRRECTIDTRMTMTFQTPILASFVRALCLATTCEFVTCLQTTLRTSSGSSMANALATHGANTPPYSWASATFQLRSSCHGPPHGCTMSPLLVSNAANTAVSSAPLAYAPPKPSTIYSCGSSLDGTTCCSMLVAERDSSNHHCRCVRSLHRLAHELESV